MGSIPNAGIGLAMIPGGLLQPRTAWIWGLRKKIVSRRYYLLVAGTRVGGPAGHGQRVTERPEIR